VKAERYDEMQGRLQRSETDHGNATRAAQQAQTRVHTLETELAAANAELKALRTGESESLRRQFANLENKITSLGGGLEEREQINRARELQQVTRERDSLGTKVEQLINEVAKL
jgi:chromosome segregation ATPase